MCCQFPRVISFFVRSFVRWFECLFVGSNADWICSDWFLAEIIEIESDHAHAHRRFHVRYENGDSDFVPGERVAVYVGNQADEDFDFSGIASIKNDKIEVGFAFLIESILTDYRHNPMSYVYVYQFASQGCATLSMFATVWVNFAFSKLLVRLKSQSRRCDQRQSTVDIRL